jgi:hypothetical protein
LNFPGFPFDNYPKYYQDPDESTCVPVCFKTVLDIMKKWVKGIPDISVKEIAEIIETTLDGTPLGTNINKINEKLQATIPHIEFDVDYSGVRWKTIISDVMEENPLHTPVIAIIKQYDSQELDWMVHAVVILYAANDYTVYWDPIYGEMTEPTSKFFQQWDSLYRICVRLKHVPRVQRLLEEFPKEKEEEQ